MCAGIVEGANFRRDQKFGSDTASDKRMKRKRHSDDHGELARRLEMKEEAAVQCRSRCKLDEDVVEIE